MRLEALRGKQSDAKQRVREVEAGHRAATRELKAARVNLAEVEVGGAPKQIEAAREGLTRLVMMPRLSFGGNARGSPTPLPQRPSSRSFGS